MPQSDCPKLKWFILLLVLICTRSEAQELYVFTEPASNMATKSIGLRLNNSFMNETNTSKINYHLIPEVMIGVSKKVMLHVDAFISNRSNAFDVEGGSLYAKYRFLSTDDVHKHFRMAAFGRLSFNGSDIHQEEINVYAHNTGVEGGIIATQLVHKVAVSSGISFVKAMDNGKNRFIYGEDESRALNYTFSVGKLMLPKEYKDYKQTNLNLMLESLSQLNLGSGNYYSDIAPSIQFIFNSQSRVDLGYRLELGSTLNRTAPKGLFVRLEYNLFNAY